MGHPQKRHQDRHVAGDFFSIEKLGVLLMAFSSSSGFVSRHHVLCFFRDVEPLFALLLSHDPFFLSPSLQQ